MSAVQKHEHSVFHVLTCDLEIEDCGVDGIGVGAPGTCGKELLDASVDKPAQTARGGAVRCDELEEISDSLSSRLREEVDPRA